MEQHILGRARNILEQALQRASDDLGEALALVWKEAALKARLEAGLVPTPEGSPSKLTTHPAMVPDRSPPTSRRNCPNDRRRRSSPPFSG
jgi:hypothetical protein